MTEEEKRLQQQQNNTPAPEVKQPTQPAPQTDDVYTQTMNTLKANSKPVYSATYDAQIRDVYDQIVNRDKFAYDINADALYQQYKDQYVNLGKMAMKDTMGQAAALTGGYGSSYGQSVGQQQYDAYLQRLNEVVPQLYGQAYTAYKDEGDALMQQYAMLGDMADDEYAKYNDAYNKYWAELDYNKTQLLDMINSTGYVPTPEEVSAAGMTQEQVDLILNTWRLQNPDLAYKNGTITPEQYKQLTGKYPAGYGRGSGGGGGGSGYDPAVAAEQQRLKDLGLYTGEVDGIAGPLTQAAIAAELSTGGAGEESADVTYFDYDSAINSQLQTEKGGSYYSDALADLEEMARAGKSNSEVNSYLTDMVGNSYITQNEYRTLVSKWRNGKLK